MWYFQVGPFMFSLVPQINKNLRDSKMPWTPCVHGFNVMAVVHTLLFTVKPELAENTGKWNRSGILSGLEITAVH